MAGTVPPQEIMERVCCLLEEQPADRAALAAIRLTCKVWRGVAQAHDRVWYGVEDSEGEDSEDEDSEDEDSEGGGEDEDSEEEDSEGEGEDEDSVEEDEYGKLIVDTPPISLRAVLQHPSREYRGSFIKWVLAGVPAVDAKGKEFAQHADELFWWAVASPARGVAPAFMDFMEKDLWGHNPPKLRWAAAALLAAKSGPAHYATRLHLELSDHAEEKGVVPAMHLAKEAPRRPTGIRHTWMVHAWKVLMDPPPLAPIVRNSLRTKLYAWQLHMLEDAGLTVEYIGDDTMSLQCAGMRRGTRGGTILECPLVRGYHARIKSLPAVTATDFLALYQLCLQHSTCDASHVAHFVGESADVVQWGQQAARIMSSVMSLLNELHEEENVPIVIDDD